MISQDTSAYGVDLRYPPATLQRPRIRDALPRPGARAGRAGRLGAHALCLSLSARRRRAAADGRGPGAALPRHSLPARQPLRAQAHEAARARREHAGAHPRLAPRSARISRCAAPSSSAFPAKPTPNSRSCWSGSTTRSSIASAASSTRRSKAPPPMTLAGSVAPEVMEERHARFMERAAAISEARLAAKVGRELTGAGGSRRRQRRPSRAPPATRRRSTAWST